MPSTHPRREHSRERLIVMLAIGLAVGALVGWLWRPLYAPLAAWAACCAVYLTWVWAQIWRMDGHQTARHAVREDPGRAVVDILLLICAVSLQVDLVVVLSASHASGSQSRWIALLGLASVVLSWALTQTLFTLRYAHLYHTIEHRALKQLAASEVEAESDDRSQKRHPGGGIDFNRPGYRPTYQDFAYFSFNLGMTFQVSDTTVSEPAIRVTVLRQTLLSYMFTTLVLANVINVVVGILP